ncbi:MAG: LysE family translocator [Anaerolineales bacterium]|nr:LysE family translocator [Anaerolineales bacterium]
MDTIIRGILLGLSITMPVGPTNVEVIRRGAKEGWKAAASFCLGVIVALVIYLILVALGLSVLTQSAVFNKILMTFGVLVLGYLAYTSIKDFFSTKEVDLEAPSGSNKHFVPGIVLTISNPAVLLLWTGIMGADLAGGGGSRTEGMLLSAGILIGVVIFFTGLTYSIHFGRSWLQRRYLRYFSLIAGIALAYFCVKFASTLIEHLF